MILSSGSNGEGGRGSGGEGNWSGGEDGCGRRESERGKEAKIML